ncbi:TonB-dependent receptor [Sphingobacterium faecium]|uniref:SusC/RagA family TonB-linked outer membrane protein n=1 Tax=Sphingobacterium faecium TaxID=34087 RepID=UPI0021B4DDAB|nr:TonB-dependent receptor [Sphingobacterium faecium]UXD69279.1 TonB-dependent receptor [Sphingobacterium faecium]
MKKNLHGQGFCVPKSSTIKYALMTKLTVALTFAFAVKVFGISTSAQEKVSLKIRNTDLKTVLKTIEKQTNVKFVYFDNLVSNKNLSSVAVENQAWNNALIPLLNQFNLTLSSYDGVTYVITPVKNPVQGITIKGKILNSQGMPLAGVTIVEKNKDRGTSTDDKGEFSLKVNEATSILLISNVGFISQEIKVSQSFMTITLQEDLTSLAEVVVVGYGTQKKANLTGAVSSVEMDKVLGDRPVSSSSQALQGALPGLQVTFGGGRPGTGTDLNIRGVTSINGGSPLILVDNVPMNMDDVNPKDILNVTVLKDAAAASIYGARAAFGVILVTTKKGARNQPTKINYSSNLTWSSPSTLPEKASPLQFVQALKDFGNTSNWAGQNVDTWLEKLKDYQVNPNSYPDGITEVNGTKYPLREYDLYKEVFQTGFEHLHNLSIQGGSEKIAYRLSGMYSDEDGIMTTRKDSYKRYNLNAYVGAELKKNLNISANILYKNDERYTPANFGEMFYRALSFGSYLNPGETTDSDGNSIPFGTPNNYLKYEDPTRNYNDNLRLFGKLDYNPLPGWNIALEYTFSKTNNNSKYAQNKHRYMNPNNFNPEYLFNNDFYERSNTLINYNALNIYSSYSHAIAEHHFKVLAGANYEKSYSENFSAKRFGVLSPDSPSLGTSTGTQTTADSFGQYAVLGYFGRINYDYQNKYLLEVNGRLDGSSRFQKGSQFGFFPSVSAGWNVTEEGFMSDLKNSIPLLKFRGSYGSIGNQVVLNNVGGQVYFPVIPQMTTSNTNWIDPTTGVRYLTINAPNLISSTFTWEQVRTLNVGVDIALLNNRLSTSFDWFRRQTIGMLYQGADLPAVLGSAPPFQNTTDLESKGWEWELSWKDQIKDFRYGFTFNLSDNRGYITRIENSAGLIDGYYEGKEIGEIWGYVSDRFYTTQDFEDNSLNPQLINGTLKSGIPAFKGVKQNPGDMLYTDLNGDGILFSGTGTLTDPGDMKVIGNNNRRYQFGVNAFFNYKNFDLSVFLQGVGKRDLWLSNFLMWPYNNEFGTLYQHNLDYWTPENTDAEYGRVYANAGLNTGANRRVQTKYLSNGAYLRVRNITLAYTLAKNVLRSKAVDNIKFFVSGENLFKADHMPKGMEADGQDLGSGGIYPFLKKYSFGVNVTF